MLLQPTALIQILAGSVLLVMRWCKSLETKVVGEGRIPGDRNREQAGWEAFLKGAGLGENVKLWRMCSNFKGVQGRGRSLQTLENLWGVSELP